MSKSRHTWNRISSPDTWTKQKEEDEEICRYTVLELVSKQCQEEHACIIRKSMMDKHAYVDIVS